MNQSRSVPRTRHGGAVQATREALLKAARALFARHGYDGTSVRAITRAAHANLGAITYHFGSKKALYRDVLQRAFGPLPDRIQEVVSRDEPVLDRCEAVIETYFDHLTGAPDVPFLLLQEIAAGKPPPEPVGAVFRRLVGYLTALVREGQDRGEIRAGDPLHMAMSLIAQPIYFSLVREPIRHVLGRVLTGPDVYEGLVGHASSFARAGLATPTESP